MLQLHGDLILAATAFTENHMVLRDSTVGGCVFVFLSAVEEVQSAIHNEQSARALTHTWDCSS